MDRIRVGLRGAQLVLPLRKSPATSKLLRHDGCVLGWQMELDPLRYPIGDRPHDRLGGMIGRSDGDPKAHVEVAVAVDVREVGALRSIDEQRWVIVEEGHPRQRHAEGHRGAGPLPEGERPGMLVHEASVFSTPQVGDALQVDAVVHPRQRYFGITSRATISKTESSCGASRQLCGQYRTNSSIPIARYRPTMSSK